MKYYKATNDNIFAYEDDAKQIKDGLIAITELEKDEILSPTQAEIEVQTIAHFKSLYLELFNAKLKELDYDSIATVQLWMSDATFGAEATKIMTWYKALITKNYVILNDAKVSGVIPTDEEYLTEIAKVVF